MKYKVSGILLVLLVLVGLIVIIWQPSEPFREETSPSQDLPMRSVIAPTPDVNSPTAGSSFAATFDTAVAFMRDYPTLSAPDRMQRAVVVTRKLKDEDWPPLLPLFLNPKTDEAVLQILFEDLLNRPNELKIPALVKLVGLEGHPAREESIELLQRYLGYDPGDDPQAWEAAARAQLQKDALDIQLHLGE